MPGVLVPQVGGAGAKNHFMGSGGTPGISSLTTVGSSPEQFAEKMKSDMVKRGKIIKAAGIRAD